MSYPKSEAPHGVMLPAGKVDEEVSGTNPGVERGLDELLNSELVRTKTDLAGAEMVTRLTSESERDAELARLDDELRYKGLKVPEKELDAKAAEAWTRERISELSTRAVLEVNYSLTRGSNKERIEAAKDILDRAGFARTSDVRGGSSAPVLVLVGAAVSAPPWAQKTVDVTPAPQVHPDAVPSKDTK